MVEICFEFVVIDLSLEGSIIYIAYMCNSYFLIGDICVFDMVFEFIIVIFPVSRVST